MFDIAAYCKAKAKIDPNRSLLRGQLLHVSYLLRHEFDEVYSHRAISRFVQLSPHAQGLPVCVWVTCFGGGKSCWCAVANHSRPRVNQADRRAFAPVIFVQMVLWSHSPLHHAVIEASVYMLQTFSDSLSAVSIKVHRRFDTIASSNDLAGPAGLPSGVTGIWIFKQES